MAEKLLFTRHGAATQERRTIEELAYLESLPDDEFTQEILAMNMRQGLTELGRLETNDLGRRIGQIILPDAGVIVALVGPYKRHIESAEAALAVPELADRNIQVIVDPRLAERSRGRLDASIWPARKLRELSPEHQYGDQYKNKEEHPATWRPPQGENYEDVNFRVDEVLNEHSIKQNSTPTIIFGSGEMSLASLKLSDEEYRRGTVSTDGKPMSLLTLNNAGVVELKDPWNTGHPTSWQIHDPQEVSDGREFEERLIVSSRIGHFKR